MRNYYNDLIAEIAPDYNPDEVETYMRLKLHTLDHLPPDLFRVEILEAMACIDADPVLAARLVATYKPLGLLDL